MQLHVALDTLRMLLAAFLAMLGRGSISSSALDAGSTDDHTLRAQASRSNQMQAMGESVELRPPAGSAAAAPMLTIDMMNWTRPASFRSTDKLVVLQPDPPTSVQGITGSRASEVPRVSLMPEKAPHDPPMLSVEVLNATPLNNQTITYAALPPPAPAARPAPLHLARPPPVARGGGRGTYDRSGGVGCRRSWAAHLEQHMEQLNNGSLFAARTVCSQPLSGTGECPFGDRCLDRICLAEAKECARESFGSEAAADSPDWTKCTRNHAAVAAWFDLARAGAVVADNGAVTSIDYKVAGKRLCPAAWAHVRGITRTTATTIHRQVMKGATQWSDTTTRELEAVRRHESGVLVRAAGNWWYTRLGWYEMVVECGTITHPADIEWLTVYRTEFVPEMIACDVPWDPAEMTAPVPRKAGSGLQCEECEDSDAKGSRASWYKGRAWALEVLAADRGLQKSFRFISRKRHCMYKECAECQAGRLAVADAISQRLGAEVIAARKKKLTDHHQWIYKQRDCLDLLINEGSGNFRLVEAADKCGDECLFLPASQRASSANTSRYKYRVSVQANCFVGKLFQLNVLLPNLTTGANFGMTSSILGLARLIQSREITPQHRRYLRSNDGGSENCNFASLALNSTLVKERVFDEVVMTRLPPDHSHHYLTDGAFSVIEGWLTGNGFAGCHTVWDLIKFLRGKFSTASNYSNKRVEISVLIANFAFVKWFDGCVNADKISNIGVPLVWRHTWVPETQTVRVQYKYAISDSPTFERDEWGPWMQTQVQTNDATGKVVTVGVLRSDPAGVDLMCKYPDIAADPGVEPWKAADDWEMKKVFSDLAKWDFGQVQQSQAARAAWSELGNWHLSNPAADTFVASKQEVMSQGAALPTLPESSLSWNNLWSILKRNAPVPLQRAPQPAAPPPPPVAGQSRRHDREHLGTTSSAAEANIVIHPGYTKANQAEARLLDDRVRHAYVRDNLEKQDAVFFVELGELEGELAVGLARRTFNSEQDKLQDEVYEMQWYRRKSTNHSWGQGPTFKLATKTEGRRKVPEVDMISIDTIIPLAVQMTRGSSSSSVKLTKCCMQALRQLHDKAETRGSESGSASAESEDDSDDDDAPRPPSKRCRAGKSVLCSDDEEI